MTGLPWAVSLDLVPTVRIVSLADGGDLATAPDVAILWRPGSARPRDEALADAERIVAAVNGVERQACGHLAADRDRHGACGGCVREAVARGADLSSMGPDFAGLPPCVRDYIAAIETNADPSGMVRENVLARDEIAALRRKVIEVQQEAAEERAAVVEWLRAQNLDGDESLGDDLITELIGEFADAIERGDHRP